MNNFIFCNEKLPGSKEKIYLIVTKCTTFLNGQLFAKPEYHISAAQYLGNGKWLENEEIYIPITDEPIQFTGSILTSVGTEKTEICDDSEGFERIEKVVGYSPFPSVKKFCNR